MSTIEPIETGLQLRVLEGSHSQATHPLERSVVSIGRTTAETPCTSSYLTFPEPTVSRLHALLTWEPGVSAYMVHHRSQTNPTLLNGKALTRSELLKPGDVLSLGRLVIRIEQAQYEESLPSIEQEGEKRLCLCLHRRGDRERCYSVPVEGKRVILSFNDERSTAAIAGQRDASQQHVVLPGSCATELSFTFEPEQTSAEVEIESTTPTIRRTALDFGILEVPLRNATPWPFTARDALLHQGYLIWLAQNDEASPPGGTLEDSPLRKPPAELSAGAPGGPILHFLSGAWKGAQLRMREKGSYSFELGPKSESLIHPSPLTGETAVSITTQGLQARLRVIDMSDDQFVDINGELLFTGESTPLFSGAKLLLGEAEFSWLVPALHKEYTSYHLSTEAGPIPITKQEIRIGTAAHCEARIDSPSLAPVAGVLRFGAEGFVYKHQNIALPARIDNVEVSAGLEAPVRSGSSLELAPGLTVQLEERC